MQKGEWDGPLAPLEQMLDMLFVEWIQNDRRSIII